MRSGDAEGGGRADLPSLTKGIGREMRTILRDITEEPMDFEKLVDRTEIVGPELNFHLVRMKRKGLVEYRETEPTVTLTPKGRLAAAALAQA